MAIPKYNELYNDVLQFLSDNKEYHTRYVKEAISDSLNLTDSERNELLPSKRGNLVENRVGWAITYLKKAGLVESKKRAYINITKLGLDDLSKNMEINNQYLLKYESFRKFYYKKHEENKISDNNNLYNFTPEEEIENAYNQINDKLIDELIENILNINSSLFEKLIVDLLLKMGYGEFRPDTSIMTTSLNEECVCGIINQDKLGLEKIAIQAKRFNLSQKIDRQIIQNFAGALIGKGLNKGVFITTSSFSNDAYEYINNQNLTIILIDGEKLAKLMIEYNLGTFTIRNYSIKKIDSDYFNMGE